MLTLRYRLKKNNKNKRGSLIMAHQHSLNVLSSLHNQQVFITGASGFLGKAIVEKILREVPGIGRIYLLIRGSQQQSAQERAMEGVFGSSLFDVLRTEHGEHFESFINEKVQIVEGELTKPMFGLDKSAFAGIASELNLIINSAASVNFREAMDQALEINTLCLNNIVALANYKSAPQRVTPVVQVSTCYVNGLNKGVMREEVAAPASGLIDAIDHDTYAIDKVIAKLQQKIEGIRTRFTNKVKQDQKLIELGISQSRHYGWNDTYTFTKWMGEQLLIQGLGKNNLTLLRPSIIESTISSPVPGWVEGVKVADALIYAYAKGRVSIFPGDDNGLLDVIPVDLVANAVLLSGAELLTKSEGYRIYQCCSGSSNPIRLKQFIDYMQQASLEQYQSLPKLFASKPSETFKTVSPKKFRLYMRALTSYTWIKTSASRLLGSKSADKQLLKARTTASLAMIFGFYTAAKYRFDSTKLEQLSLQFSQEEQGTFQILASSFTWKNYLQDIHLPGLHKYALAHKKSLVKTKSPVQDNKQAA
jgi:fatty acyl-CoA reductase